MKKGKIGGTVGKLSEEHARDRAVLHCIELGGSDCEVLSTFDNACGAIAWPTLGGRVATSTGSTTKIASQLALDTCEEAEGKGCQIFYSECSNAIYQPL